MRCRVKRPDGKLVEGILLHDDCTVVSLVLEGEFFADPILDELLSRLRGTSVNQLVETLEEETRSLLLEPREDILECVRMLVKESGC